MKRINKDVVVIGAGLSGLYTSLHLAPELKIAVISKDALQNSNSSLAQGGIASWTNDDDSVMEHLNDTMKAGSLVNNVDAVSLLVSMAPSEIYRLIELGVEFDTDDQGMVLTTLEGGHSHRRVLHANGDATGKVIMEHVVAQSLEKDNMEIFEQAMALKIVKDKEQVYGVIVLIDNEMIFIQARIVVVATGGVGAVYRDTTNHSFSTGDGVVLAKEAGCHLVDMCFVQFHPTAFYKKGTTQRFLITEAVRGEGGLLLNTDLKRFMPSYDEREELAPRDVVSRSIFQELGKTGSEHVWLDITHKDSDYLTHRFPTIYDFLKEQDIYMEKDYIPVAPVAHYFVGGVASDLDGKTSVDGIYAIGEVSSTGVHGANRLASNSLLECVVFGKRGANHINRVFGQMGHHKYSYSKDKEAYVLEALNIFEEAFPLAVNCGQSFKTFDFPLIKSEIQKIMTHYVGIVRTDEGLLKAKESIKEYEKQLEAIKGWNSESFEIRNLCVVAMEMIEDGLSKKSIGCHYKVDINTREV